MSITLYAKLDMTPGAVPTVVHRSQYDSDFTLVFSLYTRTGDFVIASGTTARMRGTKTTGTGYSVPVTLNVSAKTVTVTGDQQMTAAAGSNIFEIVLYQGDLEICSSNFVLAVERAAMDMDTITDATVVPELERLDEYIEQAAEYGAREGAAYAESWAVGGTGKREGEDTNNAKYWAEQASGVVHGVTSYNGRTGAVVPASGDYTTQTVTRSGNPLEDSLATIESNTASVASGLTALDGRVTTAEGTISSQGTRLGTAESDIDALETRATTAEGNITSQGTRLTTAEGDIDALETRATTAESNITTLQNNKVDMTTPLLNFDDTAVDPTTDDGALANALTALGILNDVIPSGGGLLYLKKVLMELCNRVNFRIVNITSDSVTIAGSGTTWSTVPKPTSGNVVSLAGYYISGSTTVNIYAYYLSGSGAMFALRNMGTTSVTITIQARFLIVD